MKNFKLWMGCLGNGITVCNSAVENNGEYKHIAHISNNGKIKLYISKSYIPVEDMQRIEQTAADRRKTFLTEWNKQPDIEKYEKLLDMCSLSDLTETAYNKEIPLAEDYFNIIFDSLDGSELMHWDGNELEMWEKDWKCCCIHEENTDDENNYTAFTELDPAWGGNVAEFFEALNKISVTV